VSNNEVVIARIILNNIATQNPSTLNPAPNNFEVSKIIPALITNKNKPSVTTVIGKVRKIRIGLTNTFKMIRIADTSIAIDILVTSTPGIKLAMRKMANAVVTTLNKNCKEFDLEAAIS
jgi:hypothetical protein